MLHSLSTHREFLVTDWRADREIALRTTNFLFATGMEALKGAPRALSLFLRGDYRGEIETEGLGIMAHDMGHQCWGMPNLEVRHAKE